MAHGVENPILFHELISYVRDLGNSSSNLVHSLHEIDHNKNIHLDLCYVPTGIDVVNNSVFATTTTVFTCAHRQQNSNDR